MYPLLYAWSPGLGPGISLPWLDVEMLYAVTRSGDLCIVDPQPHGSAPDGSAYVGSLTRIGKLLVPRKGELIAKEMLDIAIRDYERVGYVTPYDSNVLYHVDLQTAVCSPVMGTDGAEFRIGPDDGDPTYALEFLTSGILFAWTQSGKLYRIDLTKPESTLYKDQVLVPQSTPKPAPGTPGAKPPIKPPLKMTPAGDLAYHVASNTLYGTAGGGYLIEIDLGTGNVADVTPNPLPPWVSPHDGWGTPGLEIDAHGVVYLGHMEPQHQVGDTFPALAYTTAVMPPGAWTKVLYYRPDLKGFGGLALKREKLTYPRPELHLELSIRIPPILYDPPFPPPPPAIRTL